MTLENLAAELTAIEAETERENLLAKNLGLANLELAFALKEICYKFWTIEPVKARDAARALETLAKFNSEPKIVAVQTWINGIAAITRGENENAVKLLDEAAGQFRVLNEDLFAAQTQVAKIYVLALFGEYEQAIEIGKAALKIFQAQGDELSAGKVEKNIGTLLYRRGHYTEAEQFLHSAHQRFLKLDDQPELAMVENNLAVVKTYQNNFRAAETLYQQALARATDARLSATEAEIEASLGNLAFFRGRYDEALKHLQKSSRKYAELEMAYFAATTELELADVYLELNLLNEAAEIYSRLLGAFDRLGSRSEYARAQMQLGKTLIELGKTESAFEQLISAANLYQTEKNAIGSATARLLQANLYLREAEFSSAFSLASEASKIFLQEKSPRNQLLAELVCGESERRLQNWAAAVEIFTNLSAKSRQHEQLQITWICENALGEIAIAGNDNQTAENHFLTSIETIENLRRPLAADEFRTAFFVDKLAPFENLLKTYLRQNQIESALIVAERSRSQALLDLLGESMLCAAGNDSISTQIESLREELNWFYNRLNRLGTCSGVQAMALDYEICQVEIKRRERELNNLILQAQALKISSVNRCADFSLERLQHLLGDERILIEFVESKGKFSAFIVNQNETEFVENVCSSREIEEHLERLHFQFTTLRYGAKRLEKHLPELKRRARIHLQNIYEILLRPLEDRFGDKSLVVAGAGNLHYVPFHALHDGERFVVERRAVSYTPSASVLQFLAEKPQPKFEKILAVGFADERVAQVESEVSSLAEIMPETRVLIGAAATFAAVEENLKENFDVLHLACHAQFRAENPLFSSLRLADGWATVRDASKLQLENSLVVLSACETGLNRIAAGDELLGLVRGFLAAGAGALVLTLWTVNDEAAARLMREFYKNLQNEKSLATSLRKAQLNLIEQGFHPYFWSPFALVGSW